MGGSDLRRITEQLPQRSLRSLATAVRELGPNRLRYGTDVDIRLTPSVAALPSLLRRTSVIANVICN